jgi:hypothetical protein
VRVGDVATTILTLGCSSVMGLCLRQTAACAGGHATHPHLLLACLHIFLCGWCTALCVVFATHNIHAIPTPLPPLMVPPTPPRARKQGKSGVALFCGSTHWAASIDVKQATKARPRALILTCLHTTALVHSFTHSRSMHSSTTSCE